MEEDFKAIRDRFLDSLATIGIPEYQIIMDNQVGEDVDEAAPWARFQIRPGENREELIGGNTVIITQIGQIILQVFGPKGSGSQETYVTAHKFSEAFRKWISKSATGHIRAYWSGYRNVASTEFLQVNASVYYESTRRYPR